MRNNLPKKVNKNECGIINLDDKSGEGSHWTCYVKQGNIAIYFDPFGNLKPPLELITYFKSSNSTVVKYNYDALQTYGSYNCGHLCLLFLYNIYN